MEYQHNYNHDISKAIASCVQLCFERDKTTLEDAKTFLESLVPEFKQDKAFQDIFPIVFQIETCKRNLTTNKQLPA